MIITGPYSAISQELEDEKLVTVIQDKPKKYMKSDEKEFESFTKSIDTDFGINESAFTFTKNDKIIESFDDTEKEDFYEKCCCCRITVGR